MSLKRIIIVDHQQSFVDFCRNHLEPKGFKVRAVVKGGDGLALMQTEPFDLAVIELWPFDMDSLEIVHKMRQQGLTLPVIIACDQPGIAVKQVTMALQLGVVAFIEKLCRAEILVNVVQQALNPVPYQADFGRL